MVYILREENARVDLFSKVASIRVVANNRSVIQEVVEELSISVASHSVYALQSRKKAGNNPSWSI